MNGRLIYNDETPSFTIASPPAPLLILFVNKEGKLDAEYDPKNLTSAALALIAAVRQAQAGYGNVQEALLSAADEMEQERATWCLDDTGRYWIARTLNELRERAHSLDPEGHALVQAIHDRKAEGESESALP